MTQGETFLPELRPCASTHQNIPVVFLSALTRGAVGMAVNRLPGWSQLGTLW